MITPLRQAAIFSDFESRVLVRPIGMGDPEDLPWSHGACFAHWSEASPEELMFSMLQVFAMLVEQARIPVSAVHDAFCAIPEYRATLLSDHPDALTPGEWRRLHVMMDLPRSFRAADPSYA